MTLAMESVPPPRECRRIGSPLRSSRLLYFFVVLVFIAIIPAGDYETATLVDVEKSYQKAKQAKRVPKLIVNLNGKVVAEYEIKDKKMTIGRSSLADLQIHDERVSKFHALLMIYSDALVIADLNSVNGTFVNSRKVSSTLLKSNDILSLSDYRIKVVDAPSGAEEEFGASQGDTSRMKTLDDMRRQSTTSKKNA